MGVFIVFILGLIIGSFLNVCIFRIPEEQSISYPPSHCSNCNHRLNAFDLIPLISYMLLKGKCRYCKNEISIQYPIIELLNASLYALIFSNFGYTVFTIKYCIFCSLLIVIGIIDLKTQFVYTCTTIFGGVCGISFMVIESIISKSVITNYIIGGIIGFGVIGLIVFLTKGMGEGDIEIAAVCGLFLGVKGILITLLLAVIIGGTIGIIVVLLNLKTIKEKIAFGPCIAIGALIATLYANQLIDYYLKLFM